MREAINENPRVQLAIFGTTGLILLLFLLKPFGGGGEEPAAEATPPADAPASAALSGEAAPAPTAPPAPDPASPAPATSPSEPDATAPAAPPTGAGGKLAASEGFPVAVVDTLNADKLVVLFIYDPQGLTDEELKQYTERLRGDDRLKLIEVKEKDVADYSRIIGVGGLGVDRTPALVTVAPPESAGAEPVAAVSYGFRRSKSVRQAVVDALYDGRIVTSYPR